MIKSRIGTFKIDTKWLENVISNNETKQLAALQQAFALFFPVEIKNSFIENHMIYSGYSHQFDEVENGTTIPEYDIEFVRTSIEQGDEILFSGFKRKL